MNGEPAIAARFRAALDSLAARAKGDPRALATLAAMAAENGLAAQAFELANEARALAPEDPEVTLLAGRAASAEVHAWHFSIVRDAARNAAYRAAIERAIRSGDRVLEIGAGTGLLSMMAARAGAEVVACEMNPAIAAAAVRIVAHNGLADRVRILARHSGDLDATRDLGGPVDLIVSEILSNDLLVEQVLPVMADVVPRLLKDGGRAIPAGGAIRVALAEWQGLEQRRVGNIDGFDLSPFNALERVPYSVKPGDPRLTLRSAPADLFRFDFAGGGPYAPGRAAVPLACAGGPINGVVQWIQLELDEQGRYENRPAPGATSCWSCLFYPFETPAEPGPGTSMTVHGVHTLTTLRIWAASG